jgi:hypothetical protein
MWTNNETWCLHNDIIVKLVKCNEFISLWASELYPTFVIIVLHNLHFPLLYKNPPLKVHLHFTPNILTSIIQPMYLYGLNLFTLTNTRLFSYFWIVTNNIILFGKTCYILYGPNHFLVIKLPYRCDLFPFGNHIT